VATTRTFDRFETRIEIARCIQIVPGMPQVRGVPYELNVQVIQFVTKEIDATIAGTESRPKRGITPIQVLTKKPLKLGRSVLIDQGSWSLACLLSATQRLWSYVASCGPLHAGERLKSNLPTN
jgi:hypothetical protein